MSKNENEKISETKIIEELYKEISGMNIKIVEIHSDVRQLVQAREYDREKIDELKKLHDDCIVISEDHAKPAVLYMAGHIGDIQEIVTKYVEKKEMFRDVKKDVIKKIVDIIFKLAFAGLVIIFGLYKIFEHLGVIK